MKQCRKTKLLNSCCSCTLEVWTEQCVCSMWLNVGESMKIKSTLVLSAIHQKCIRSPNTLTTFLQH